MPDEFTTIVRLKTTYCNIKKPHRWGSFPKYLFYSEYFALLTDLETVRNVQNAKFPETDTTLESFLEVPIMNNSRRLKGAAFPSTKFFITKMVLYQTCTLSGGRHLHPSSDSRRRMDFNRVMNCLLPTEKHKIKTCGERDHRRGVSTTTFSDVWSENPPPPKERETKHSSGHFRNRDYSDQLEKDQQF